MKQSLKQQIEAIKSIRKPLPPSTRIQRQEKGYGSYNRPQGNWKKWLD